MAKQTKPVEEAKNGQNEYVFNHPNAFLTISYLGVQFMHGEYRTTDRELAKQLVEFEDMKLVSQPK